MQYREEGEIKVEKFLTCIFTKQVKMTTTPTGNKNYKKNSNNNPITIKKQ